MKWRSDDELIYGDIITSIKSTSTSYTDLVCLVIIDEIHLPHDDRGPVLEAIIALTICCMEQTNEFVCLIGLSTTLSNFQDVATFLCVDEKKGPFYLDATYWPCGLQQQFISITEKSWTKSAMERSLISPLSLSTLARKLQKLLIPQGYDCRQRNHHPIC